MFLLGYFESDGSGDAAGFAAVSLIPVLRLYLTDFWESRFLGENAQNRAFFGGEKLETAALYLPLINQGPAAWKPALCLPCLYFWL
jgi:hypothetical protein